MLVLLWKCLAWCCVWKLWKICEIISLGHLIRNHQICISEIFYELFEKVLHELKWTGAVSCSCLGKSESYGISSGWMFCLEGRKRKLVKRHPSSLSIQKCFFDFFLLTVPSMLGYCKSLLCPYPWAEACVNNHFLLNLAVLVLSVSLAFRAVKATEFCCCGWLHLLKSQRN